MNPAKDTTGAFPFGSVSYGMHLRDYFAARAMQAILGVLVKGIRPTDCIRAAEDAYYIADAMMKARDA